MKPTDVDDDNPWAPPSDREESALDVARSSTWLLVIALIAVVLGVFHEAPGLGIFLSILVVPALARTFIGAARRPARWEAMSAFQRLGAFVVSLGIVVVIGVAACIAFFLACIPSLGLRLGGPNDWNGPIYVGLAAALIVILGLGWLFWPRRDPS